MYVCIYICKARERKRDRARDMYGKKDRQAGRQIDLDRFGWIERQGGTDSTDR